MADSAELRKHLESALEDIPADAVERADEVVLTSPIATYSVSNGYVTSFQLLPPAGKRCVQNCARREWDGCYRGSWHSTHLSK